LPMRPVFVTAGAVLLVLGASMMAAGPFVLSTGYVRQELELIQSNPSGTNSSQLLSIYDSVANQGEFLVITGALLAPVGAGLMAYGLTARKQEAPPQPALPTQMAA